MTFRLPAAGADLYSIPRIPHMHAAIAKSKLTPASKRVLKWVVQRVTGGWETIHCALGTVADALKVSYKTVQRAIEIIKQLGILEVHQESSSCGAPTVYRPHLELVTSASLSRVADAKDRQAGAIALAALLIHSAPERAPDEPQTSDISSPKNLGHSEPKCPTITPLPSPTCDALLNAPIQGDAPPFPLAAEATDSHATDPVKAEKASPAPVSVAKKALTALAGVFLWERSRGSVRDEVNAVLQLLADDAMGVA